MKNVCVYVHEYVLSKFKRKKKRSTNQIEALKFDMFLVPANKARIYWQVQFIFLLLNICAVAVVLIIVVVVTGEKEKGKYT